MGKYKEIFKMTKQCQNRVFTGWFSSKPCPNPARFRCPVCGKWICESHGIPFTAHFWSEQLSGCLCGTECQKKLFGWPAILKNYARKEGYVDSEWGLISKPANHIGSGFTINNRDIDELIPLGYQNLTWKNTPGVTEFQNRKRE